MDIKLRETQIPWFNRIVNNILPNYAGYIDTSPMRSGKSIIAMAVAKEFNYSMVVFCPPSVIAVWENYFETYGIVPKLIISYDSLGGHKKTKTVKAADGSEDHITRITKPKHGLLTRIDRLTEKGKRKIEFQVTDKWRDWVKEGILAIFDEFDEVVNPGTNRTSCCRALINYISKKEDVISRFGLLSGTPFDKKEQAISLMKTIGLIESKQLWRRDARTKEATWTGVDDLYQFCYQIEPAESTRLLLETIPSKAAAEELVLKFYEIGVKPAMAGSMPRGENIEGEFDIKNGAYHITSPYKEQLHKDIIALRVSTGYDPKTKAVEAGAVFGEKFNSILTSIEVDKVYDIVRVAKKFLTEVPKGKVVIGLFYTKNINRAAELLSDYGVIILNGKVQMGQRSQKISDFNNDAKVRVIVCHPKVSSRGISLFDTKGDEPRLMLLSPNYNMKMSLQFANRIYGFGSRGDAKVRFPYAFDEEDREVSILTALIQKGTVMRRSLADPDNADFSKLPDEFEWEYEKK